MGFNMAHVREMRNPTRFELDEVAPDNPVFLIDASCHAGFVNSMALARVGIDEHTPDPAGGEIERDKTGVPTGVLYENAANPLHSHSWNEYAERDPDRAVERMRSIDPVIDRAGAPTGLTPRAGALRCRRGWWRQAAG